MCSQDGCAGVDIFKCSRDREYYTFSPEVQEGLKAFSESNYRFGQEIGSLLNTIEDCACRGHQFKWQSISEALEPRDLNPAYLRPEREILIEALTSAIQIMEHAEALNGARIYFTYEIDDSDIPF